jgi:hypothetical protein
MTMAEISFKEGLDGVPGGWENAYIWYRVADALGVDVKSQLRTAKMNLSPLDLYGNDPAFITGFTGNNNFIIFMHEHPKSLFWV